MRLCRQFLLALPVLVFAVANNAKADLVKIHAEPDYTYDVTTSVTTGGTTTNQTQTAYVGQGTAALAVTGHKKEDITFWSDDYSHSLLVPTVYMVWVSTLPSLVHTRFGSDPTALNNYEKAAWLMLQGSTITPTNTTVGDLQTAIWSIFDPAVQLTPGAQAWIDTANGQDLSSFNFSGIRILTPVNCNGPRCAPNAPELLDRAVVPEPASIITLMCGFAAAAAVLRRRQRHS